MDLEIKKIKRSQLRILFTMSEILGYVKYEDIGKLSDKLNHISNEINIEDNNYIYEKIILLETDKENMTKKIGNLEMHNESLTNRIRMLEEDFERLKKSQLDKYYNSTNLYSTEGTEEENNFFHKGCDSDCNNGGYQECNNSDCSECQKDKFY